MYVHVHCRSPVVGRSRGFFTTANTLCSQPSTINECAKQPLSAPFDCTQGASNECNESRCARVILAKRRTLLFYGTISSMPGATTPLLYFVYVLESLRDHKRYVGFSARLLSRVQEHNMGLVFSTKSRLPFQLIYLEGCTLEADARRREKYLKTTRGRRFLAKRLKEYYQFRKL